MEAAYSQAKGSLAILELTMHPYIRRFFIAVLALIMSAAPLVILP